MLLSNHLLANHGVRPWLNPSRLAALAQAAASGHDWAAQVQYRQGERWYQRLEQGGNHEVWLLSWLPGQRTGFHDHCGSAGAFAVVHGDHPCLTVTSQVLPIPGIRR